MALIICSECGKQFSNKALACPACGCPTEDILREKNNQEVANENITSNEVVVADTFSDFVMNENTVKNVGNREELPAGLSETKKKRKHSLIPVIIGGVVLIAGIVCLFIFLNSPIRKINAALKENDIATVNEFFPKLTDVEDKRNVQKGVLAYCRAQYEAFRNEKLTYEETLESFDLAKEQVLTYNDEYLELRAKVDDLYRSKTAYLDACALFAKGDYRAAKLEYEKVIPEDVDYNNALAKIEECTKILTPPVIGEWISEDGEGVMKFIYSDGEENYEDRYKDNASYGYMENCIQMRISFKENNMAEYWIGIDQTKIEDAFVMLCMDTLCETWNCDEKQVWTNLYLKGIYNEKDLVEYVKGLDGVAEYIEKLENYDALEGVMLVKYEKNKIFFVNDSSEIEYEIKDGVMTWISITRGDSEAYPLDLNFKIYDSLAKVDDSKDSEVADGKYGLTISDGEMRPEFVEAMDAYEEFYDDYSDFMKRYMANPTDIGLLGEYTQMMIDAEKCNMEFEKWYDGEMTTAEMAYYMEVSVRVAEKLLEIY